MAYPNASVHQYRKAAVSSASPLQLVVMLYDGALRFLTAARSNMERGELEQQNENCKRAQDIVAELTACLDLNAGGEIAQNLFSLYGFVFDRIVQANLEDNISYLDQASRVLTELRASWAELEQKTQNHHERRAS